MNNAHVLNSATMLHLPLVIKHYSKSHLEQYDEVLDHVQLISILEKMHPNALSHFPVQDALVQCTLPNTNQLIGLIGILEKKRMEISPTLLSSLVYSLHRAGHDVTKIQNFVQKTKYHLPLYSKLVDEWIDYYCTDGASLRSIWTILQYSQIGPSLVVVDARVPKPLLFKLFSKSLLEIGNREVCNCLADYYMDRYPCEWNGLERMMFLCFGGDDQRRHLLQIGVDLYSSAVKSKYGFMPSKSGWTWIVMGLLKAGEGGLAVEAIRKCIAVNGKWEPCGIHGLDELVDEVGRVEKATFQKLDDDQLARLIINDTFTKKEDVSSQKVFI